MVLVSNERGLVVISDESIDQLIAVDPMNALGSGTVRPAVRIMVSLQKPPKRELASGSVARVEGGGGGSLFTCEHKSD